MLTFANSRRSALSDFRTKPQHVPLSVVASLAMAFTSFGAVVQHTRNSTRSLELVHHLHGRDLAPAPSDSISMPTKAKGVPPSSAG